MPSGRLHNNNTHVVPVFVCESGEVAGVDMFISLKGISRSFIMSSSHLTMDA